MQLDALKTDLQLYRTVIDKVNRNRQGWEDAKNLIFSTLTKVVKATKMKAKVEKEEKRRGMELVYLCFENRESGIYEEIGSTKRHYMKEGGYLFYTQIYNGKITVWISLPTIEDFMDRVPPKPIEVYEPSEIKEEIIIKHVSEFLKAMTEWEDKDIEHHAIGFKMRDN